MILRTRTGESEQEKLKARVHPGTKPKLKRFLDHNCYLTTEIIN